jgi:hypothetical protein
MKTVVLVLKWIASTLIVLDILFWLALHASGHKIPEDTYASLIQYFLFLTVVLLLLFFIGHKIKNK